jgi:hypothetical protein
MINHPHRGRNTVNLTFGSEVAETRIRGKVYDTRTGEIQERAEFLSRFDAGEIRALKTINRDTHPSFGRSELMSDGRSKPWNLTGREAEMSRDEICGLFDAAAKVGA